MTRTGFDPKISYVDRDDVERTEKPQSSQGDRPSDSKFVRVEKKDEWKALTEQTDLGEITDAMNGIEEGQQNTYKGPIDAILDSLVIGKPIDRYLMKKQFEIPQVPDLHKDLFQTGAASPDQMRMVVERYEALKATLEELIYQHSAGLQDAPSGDVAEYHIGNLEELKKALLTCNIELDKANYYRSVEIYKDRLARNKVLDPS